VFVEHEPRGRRRRETHRARREEQPLPLSPIRPLELRAERLREEALDEPGIARRGHAHGVRSGPEPPLGRDPRVREQEPRVSGLAVRQRDLAEAELRVVRVEGAIGVAGHDLLGAEDPLSVGEIGDDSGVALAEHGLAAEARESQRADLAIGAPREAAPLSDASTAARVLRQPQRHEEQLGEPCRGLVEAKIGTPLARVARRLEHAERRRLESEERVAAARVHHAHELSHAERRHAREAVGEDPRADFEGLFGRRELPRRERVLGRRGRGWRA
jgi:hypothetical protein